MLSETRYIEIKVKIDAEELLDMFREVDEQGEPVNETVRLEINEEGEAEFMNDNCYGNDDTIFTQTFERYDWLDDPNEEVIMSYWVDALNSCYHDDIIEPESCYTEENEEGEEVFIESKYRFDLEFYANEYHN